MLDRRHVLMGGMSLAALVAVGGPARAEAALRGEFVQGTLIRGRTEPGASVTIDGRKLGVTAAGDFAFGFAYDRTKPAELAIRLAGGAGETKSIPVATREYKIQRINGLPVQGPVTGVYGSRRILNGAEKRPHFGVDIAAGEGKAIHAPVGAIVAMAETDLYFTGGTVILDHGQGVSSSYLHMSRIDVKVGDRVAKGNVIGAIGKTGRATGPHLCWRLNWFQERLDAALVVPAMPKG